MGESACCRVNRKLLASTALRSDVTFLLSTRTSPMAYDPALPLASSSIMESMAAANPWIANSESSRGDHHPMKYVAWHIRTSHGETAVSFKTDVHKYIFHGERSETISLRFLAATKAAEDGCPVRFPGGENDTLIYISSNRRDVLAW